MLTESIAVPANTWTSIALTSAQTLLSVECPAEIRVRFGGASTSGGMLLESGQMLTVDEQVWVKCDKPGRAVVTR